MIVDPTVAAIYRQSESSDRETRAKYQDWLWKICQRDGEGAERARLALLAAIDAQHGAVRGLVDAVGPRRGRSLGNRPASADELGE